MTTPQFRITDGGQLALYDVMGDERGCIELSDIHVIVLGMTQGNDESILILGKPESGVATCLCAKYPTSQIRNKAMQGLQDDFGFWGISIGTESSQAARFIWFLQN